MIAPEIVDDRDAMQRERSRRYAEALAAAAAADERIKELTEKLEEAEYLRRNAEDAANVVTYLDDMDTHVYKVGEPEPSGDVTFVVSLVDGTIFERLRYHDDSPWHGWRRLDFTSNTVDDWDAVLEHSPLVALNRKQSDWGIDRLATLVRQIQANDTELRRRLPYEQYQQTTLERLSVLERQYEAKIDALGTNLIEERQRTETARLEGEAALNFCERFADAIRSGNADSLANVLARWDETTPPVSS